jgi:hypothetical protein
MQLTICCRQIADVISDGTSFFYDATQKKECFGGKKKCKNGTLEISLSLF